ncbi:centrosomal protein 20 isoform X2 [Hemicordylus capensis]|uniref:centrosomal protein 20 isoform X2 n=1 Tax=Hemicordylus capensis TaxID=884348 RepID=UPI002304769C|nr:centrosomal protein 20 isoform X2 [Hemicordylus capensis]
MATVAELKEGKGGTSYLPLSSAVGRGSCMKISRLLSLLKDTLEKRGALGQIKARIRAEVFNALDDQSEPRPSLSHENLLINELIREYLVFNKYKYAASVLTAESGQPEVPLDRDFLVNELNILEDPKSQSVPLLYGIIIQLLHGNREDRAHHPFPRAASSQFSVWNPGKPSHQRSQMDMVLEQGRMAATRLEDTLASQGVHR